eukprot:850025-Prorocentrum_minimum.AAC.1
MIIVDNQIRESLEHYPGSKAQSKVLTIQNAAKTLLTDEVLTKQSREESSGSYGKTRDLSRQIAGYRGFECGTRTALKGIMGSVILFQLNRSSIISTRGPERRRHLGVTGSAHPVERPPGTTIPHVRPDGELLPLEAHELHFWQLWVPLQPVQHGSVGPVPARRGPVT